MKTKISVAAVVVTYNRKILLKECLDALLAQTCPLDSIIIVDNASTDGTTEFLEQFGYLSNPAIDYVRLSENTGGAGGFYYGIKRGYEQGFNWLWIMDDDCRPLPTALAYLYSPMKSNSGNMTAISCEIIEEDNLQNAEIFSGEIIYGMDHAVFVGLALPRQLITAIGLPRKDFFIYQDDIEYALRIIKNNGEIIKVKDSKIVHPLRWKSIERSEYKFFGKTFYYPDIPAWKMYYLVRNSILLNRNYGLFQYLRSIKEAFKLVIKSIIIRSNNKFIMVIYGMMHGLLGISGIRVRP